MEHLSFHAVSTLIRMLRQPRSASACRHALSPLQLIECFLGLLCALALVSGDPASSQEGTFGRVSQLEQQLVQGLEGDAQGQRVPHKPQQQQVLMGEAHGVPSARRGHAVRVMPLAEDLNITALRRRLALNLLDSFNGPNRQRITCNGGLTGRESFAALPACPAFLPCPAFLTSASKLSDPGLQPGASLADPVALAACSAGYADPPELDIPSVPRNCRSWRTRGTEERETLLAPFLPRSRGNAVVAESEFLRRNPELGCGHRGDFIPGALVAFAVFRLERVYVSGEGAVFNASSGFLVLGCRDGRHEENPSAYRAGQHPVKHVGPALNWVFNHATWESFHVFFTAAPILQSMPGLPVLALPEQMEMYRTVLAPLLGVRFGLVSWHQAEVHDLFLAETVYQPVYEYCGHPSKAMWTDVRRRHLLHPQGIPMFNQDWSPRAPAPLSDEAMRRIPEDWVVVLAQRPDRACPVKALEEVLRRLRDVVPEERVVKLDSGLDILETRVLFRRCRLFISEYGAALNNMLFMPSGASVVEIRPDLFASYTSYHALADACSVAYNLVFATGDPSCSRMEIDAAAVMEVVGDKLLRLL